jgi:hypothetical protein
MSRLAALLLYWGERTSRRDAMPSILANLMRRIREKSFPDESLTSVAAKLGVEHFYLSKIETGKIKKPSRDVVTKMLEVYSQKYVVVMREFPNLLDGIESGHISNEDIGFSKTQLPEVIKGSGLEVLRLISDVIPDSVLDQQKNEVTLISHSSVVATDWATNSWMRHKYKAVRAVELLMTVQPQLLIVPTLATNDTSWGTTECVDDLFLVHHVGGEAYTTADPDKLANFRKFFDAAKETAYPAGRAEQILLTFDRAPSPFTDHQLEEWAKEALTVNYDQLGPYFALDPGKMEDRIKIYDRMVRGSGENLLEAGTPASVDVLTQEIRSLNLGQQEADTPTKKKKKK